VRSKYFLEGLRVRGISCTVTSSRTRTEFGFPILLGTTFWRAIEEDGGDYLLVDRCSFGDTNQFVQLVWNGHGRRGDHRVPGVIDGARWQKYGVPLKPWRRSGRRVVLCGQTESYSPAWPDLTAWYRTVTIATHFRAHPAAAANPTGLPLALDFKGCGLAVTLNSSVGVQAVLDGVPTVTMDRGAMAWDVTTHQLDAEPVTPARQEWAHWLAWTQWTDEEIRAGTPWESLL
jgi:hypothetical protein